jgi:insertion element IS1 protein InsB
MAVTAWVATSAICPPISMWSESGTPKKIERKHLTLRTRIKRLARKPICFSKPEKMHGIVNGLFINRYEFCVLV